MNNPFILKSLVFIICTISIYILNKSQKISIELKLTLIGVLAAITVVVFNIN